MNQAIKSLSGQVSEFFEFTGYQKHPLYHPIRVFDLVWDETKARGIILRTGREYDLTRPEDKSSFLDSLFRVEVPRVYALELLEDWKDHGEILKEYIGGSTVFLRDLPFLRKLYFHWRIIEERRQKLLVLNEAEIDELEDFRDLTNLARVYLLYKSPGDRRYEYFIREQ